MSTLRELLARRLRDVQAKASPAGPDEDGFPTSWAAFEDIPADSECGKILRAQADECIRQMEWARKEAKSESHRLITQQRDGEHMFVNIENVLHCHDRLWECPLTLAPEGWKP